VVSKCRQSPSIAAQTRGGGGGGGTPATRATAHFSSRPIRFPNAKDFKFVPFFDNAGRTGSRTRDCCRRRKQNTQPTTTAGIETQHLTNMVTATTMEASVRTARVIFHYICDSRIPILSPRAHSHSCAVTPCALKGACEGRACRSCDRLDAARHGRLSARAVFRGQLLIGHPNAPCERELCFRPALGRLSSPASATPRTWLPPHFSFLPSLFPACHPDVSCACDWFSYAPPPPPLPHLAPGSTATATSSPVPYR